MEMKRLEIDRLESLVGRVRQESPSTRGLLASIHRGDAITRFFAVLMLAAVVIIGGLALLQWSLKWQDIYYRFERWELVLAFFGQFFGLAVTAAVLHILYLRATHIRNMPTGPYVSLQTLALLLRTAGECLFVYTLGGIVLSILGVQDLSWASYAMSSFGSDVTEGDLKAGFKLGSVALSLASWLVGFGVFLVTYAMAGAIEVFLSIERNTRTDRDLELRGRGATGHGTEPTQQYPQNALASL